MVAVALLVHASLASADQAREDAIIVRAVERMQGYDYRNDEKVMAAIARHIDRSEGTPDFIRLIKKFRPDGIQQKLEKTLLSDDQSAAVEAVQLLSELPEGPKHIRGLLKSENASQAAQVAEILGLFGNGRAHKILSDVATDAAQPYDVRRAGCRRPGQQWRRREGAAGFGGVEATGGRHAIVGRCFVGSFGR